MRQLGLIAIVLASCGSPKVHEVLVKEEPKRLKVGETAHFVLDHDKSSSVIGSGVLDVTVTDMNVEYVTLTGKAVVQTIVGEKTFEVVGDLEQAILTPEWLGGFRKLGQQYQAKNALLTYQGISNEGCDTINLDKIKGYPDLSLEPTVCVAAQTVPSVLVIARQGKAEFRAFFRQNG